MYKISISPKLTTKTYYKDDKDKERFYKGSEFMPIQIDIEAEHPPTQNDENVLNAVKEHVEFMEITESWGIVYYEVHHPFEYNNYSVVSVDDIYTMATKPTDVPLKRSKPIKLNLPVNHMSYEEQDDECVYDTLLKMYGSKIKTVTKEYLVRFFNNCHKDDCENKNKPFAPIDKKDGVKSIWIERFCNTWDISMYCFDMTHNLMLKNTSRSKNYPTLCFYATNDHMYMINDKAFIDKVSARNKTIKNNLVSSISNDETETKNKYQKLIDEGFEVHHVKSDVQISKYNSCILIVDTNCLKPMFKDMYKQHRTLFKFKMSGNKMSYIKGPNDVHLFKNPNFNSSKMFDISVEQMKEICEKLGTEYKNDSFTSVIINEMHKYYTGQRDELTDETKNIIRKRKTCSSCRQECKKSEVDHIIPIAAGGDNSLNNLQLLCKSCHNDKTQQEKEAGAYDKFNPIESSYNGRVLKLFDSDFNKRWAFIEELNNLYKEGDKVQCLDITKCRRNIILNNKEHKWPVFSTLDDIKPFSGKLENGSFYYVECDKTFPLRGNGIYSYPIVSYCIEKNILTYDNIIKEVAPSITLKSDFFNGFIKYLLNVLPNDVAKLAINILPGYMGKIKFDKCSLNYTSSFKEASYFYIESDGKDTACSICYYRGLNG